MLRSTIMNVAKRATRVFSGSCGHKILFAISTLFLLTMPSSSTAFRISSPSVWNNPTLGFRLMPTAQPPFQHWDLREFADCKIPWSAFDGTADIAGLAEFDAVNEAFMTWQNVAPSIISFERTVAPGGAKCPLLLDNNNMIGWDGIACGAPSDDVWNVAAVPVAQRMHYGAVPGGTVLVLKGDDGWLLTTPNNCADDRAVTITPGDIPAIIDGGNGRLDTARTGDDIWVLPPAQRGPYAAIAAGAIIMIDGGNDILTRANNLPDDRVNGAGNIVDGGDGVITTAPSVDVLPNGVFAVTAVFDQASSGRILESDILFNDIDYTWQNVAHNAAQGGNPDVETIALHEIGHFLGIHHSAPKGTSNPPGPVMNPSMDPALNSNHVLATDDTDAVNWLYTPDLGDAKDPGTNMYQSLVHSGAASRKLNGVQLFKPADGPYHHFGFPGVNPANARFQFEWLGATMDNSAMECEALVEDMDTDDGVLMPDPLVRGTKNTIIVTVSSSEAAGRYDATDPKKTLHMNGYLDFNNDMLFTGADLEIWWSGTPQSPAGMAPLCTTVDASPTFVPPALKSGNSCILRFDVEVPANAPELTWCRFRLDYGEDEGIVQNISGDHLPAEGAAQFGEVEDYKCRVTAIPHLEDIHVMVPGVPVVGDPVDSSTFQGTGPYTYSLVPGGTVQMDGVFNDDPPNGLTLNTTTGALSGTPNDVPGVYHVLTEVRDSENFPVANLWWKIILDDGVAIPHITETHVIVAGTDIAMGPADVSGLTGTPPFAFTVVPGGQTTAMGTTDALPEGLTVDPDDGSTRGLTESTVPRTDDVLVVVTEKDTWEVIGFLWWEYNIVPHISEAHFFFEGFSTATPPVDQGLFVGQGPFTFNLLPAGTFTMMGIANEDLPPGLNLNPANGVVSGTPTQSGNFHVMCEVRDNQNQVVAYLWWKIFVTDGTTPFGSTVNVVAHGQPVDTGAADTSALPALGPFGFESLPAGTAVVGGVLLNNSVPAGLTIDPDTGAVSGLTTEPPGVYYVVCLVTDPETWEVVALYVWTIIIDDGSIPHFPELHVVVSGAEPAPIPVDTVPFGGNPPYFFEAVAPGQQLFSGEVTEALPEGMFIDPQTGALGGAPQVEQPETRRVLCIATDENTLQVEAFLWWDIVVLPHVEITQVMPLFGNGNTPPVDTNDFAGVPPYAFQPIQPGEYLMNGVPNVDPPQGLGIDPFTGSFFGQPQEPGVFHVLCIAEDSTQEPVAGVWWKVVVDDGSIPHFVEVLDLGPGSPVDTGPLYQPAVDVEPRFQGLVELLSEESTLRFVAVPGGQQVNGGQFTDDLPAGLSIDPQTGALSGVPQQNGISQVLCLVVDEQTWEVVAFVWWDILVDPTSVDLPRRDGPTKLVAAIPNPFNPRTSIRFEVPWSRRVRLDVYDVRGRYVTTLTDRQYERGVHNVPWNGRSAGGANVSSGIYYVRVATEAGADALKITLVQ